MKKLRDYNENLIEKGIKVAYNRSGEVRLGEVKEIKQTKHTYFTYSSDGIRPLRKKEHYRYGVLILVYDEQSGNISHITSEKNLCVIDNCITHLKECQD